jgi:hypothetical protein
VLGQAPAATQTQAESSQSSHSTHRQTGPQPCVLCVCVVMAMLAFYPVFQHTCVSKKDTSWRNTAVR